MNSLHKKIQKKQSFLCVGLDSDIDKIPLFFKRYKNPVLTFNKAIIEATKDLCVSYKLNTAFYESQGVEGWRNLSSTLDAIGYEHFTIADAKRGDIGNTAYQYAKAFFEKLNFDAITLNPYMGFETLDPYLEYEDKTLIVLGLTSNKGSQDIQMLSLDNGKPLYEIIISKLVGYTDADRLHLVVGATQGENLKKIRKIAPDNFFLVPGVGAQGGSLEDVFKNAGNLQTGLLVNVSRGIIYAGNENTDPILAVREKAEHYQSVMKKLLHGKLG